MISRRAIKILENLCDVKIIPKIDFNSEILGVRLYRDVETEVPVWLARVLIEEGLAEKVEEKEDIGKLLFKEKTSITLASMPCDLYSKIKEALKSDDNLKRRDAQDILNRRLQKILTYLRMSIMLNEHSLPKNMLVEEAVLYKYLRDSVLSWLNQFLGEDR